MHSVRPTAGVFEALELMAEKNVGAVVVVDGARVVGMVSIGDVVKSMLAEKQLQTSRRAFKIDQLETYISLAV